MPKACSQDLRERVIEAVEAGSSRREAAERFEVSASSAVKWMQRWRAAGSATSKPHGGSSSLLEKPSEWILTLVAERPDLTLDEIVATLRKRRIASSRSAVWRFFARYEISFKKSLRGGARPSGRGQSAPPLDARAGRV